MKNLAKNSKGFFSLTFVLWLGVFMTLYFTAAFAVAIAQQRDYVRSECVTGAADIQASTLKDVRKLFTMNTASTTLRTLITTNQVALAAAIASFNFPEAAHLKQTLDTLKASQQILDNAQKILILQMRTSQQVRHVTLIAKINKGNSDLTAKWAKFTTMWTMFRPTNFPEVAIRPDSIGGIAPNYEWKDDAERLQTLAYSWNMFFQTKNQQQTFIRWINAFTVECSVAPDIKEEQWRLKINADKL